MNDKRIATATVAVAAAAFVARYTPGFLMNRWADGLVRGTTEPPFGTAGEFVLFVSHAVEVVEVTAPLAIGVGFGVLIGQRFEDVGGTLRTVAGTGLSLVALATVGGFFAMGADLGFALALGAPVYAVCLLVIVGAVAGAGMDRLTTRDDEASESDTEADANTTAQHGQTS